MNARTRQMEDGLRRMSDDGAVVARTVSGGNFWLIPQAVVASGSAPRIQCCRLAATFVLAPRNRCSGG